MGAPLGENTLDHRSEIVAATIEILGTRGIAGATPQEVAAASLLSETTVRQHFPTLEALLQAAVEHLAIRHLHPLVREAPDDMPPAERIWQLCGRFWELLQLPSVAALLSHGPPARTPNHEGVNEAIRSALRLIIGSLAPLIASVAPAGSSAKADPGGAARGVVGALIMHARWLRLGLLEQLMPGHSPSRVPGHILLHMGLAGRVATPPMARPLFDSPRS
jgi:AcrR family transcriptional regulator